MDEIKQIVEQALNILYRTERELISDKLHEQTVAARLMHHLQHLLPEWHVDVEFNRQGEKRDPKTDADGTRRRPDIVIHRRGLRGPNLAVILIKCEWNNASREKDARILQNLKRRYGYQFGFLLEIKQNEFKVL